MTVIEIIEMIVIGVIAIFFVGTAVYKPLSWITIWIREGCKRNLWCIVTEDDFYQGVIIIWSIALITFGFLNFFKSGKPDNPLDEREERHMLLTTPEERGNLRFETAPEERERMLRIYGLTPEKYEEFLKKHHLDAPIEQEND